MNMDLKADFILPGTAIDQETVIRLRPKMEDYISENMGTFDHTDLLLSMNEDKTFSFELHFFKEPSAKPESKD